MNYKQLGDLISDVIKEFGDTARCHISIIPIRENEKKLLSFLEESDLNSGEILILEHGYIMYYTEASYKWTSELLDPARLHFRRNYGHFSKLSTKNS